MRSEEALQPDRTGKTKSNYLKNALTYSFFGPPEINLNSRTRNISSFVNCSDFRKI